MSTTSEIEKLYCQQLVKHYDRLSMSGLPERNPGLSEIPLEKVFIKLELKTQQFEMEDGFLYLEDDAGKLHSPEMLFQFRKDKESYSELNQFRTRLWEAKNRQLQIVNLSVAEALHRHRHLVVLGGPGAGKTTLTRWLTVNFAKKEQGRADALGEQFRQPRLPILLELRRFADRFKQHSQQPTTPDLVEEIANFVHQDSRFGNPPVELIAKALADGRCLILLDGVDEIADDGAREALTRSIQAFFLDSDRDHRENLCLVTSRPHGYQDGAIAAGFQRCEVAPFSNQDVNEFIEHWYATAYGDEEKAEAQELIEAIAANPNVSQLATNPLLCTIIAIVYRNNRVLPNRRVELYQKCCEALLDTWERTKNIRDSGLIGRYDWQTKLDLLAPVAYWLHSQAQRLSAAEDDFVEQLAHVLRNKGLVQNEIGAREEARRFIIAIRDRSGLLQGRGDGTLEFMHRTFQEYLTARYIADQPYPDYIDLVMEHLHEAWWREVHLLVIGYLGSGSGGAEKASMLMHTILDYPGPCWWVLRSIPIKVLMPSWFKRLEVRHEDNKWLNVLIRVLGLLVKSPFLLREIVARLLHNWRRDPRLAWVLQREFSIVANGYMDCSPSGTQLTLLDGYNDIQIHYGNVRSMITQLSKIY